MLSVKVGYEAEVPIKAMYIYEKLDIDVLETLYYNESPTVLWFEGNAVDFEYITSIVSKFRLEPQNVFVVVTSTLDVGKYASRGFNVVLDLDFTSAVARYIRVKVMGKVTEIHIIGKGIKPNDVLYSFDEVKV